MGGQVLSLLLHLMMGTASAAECDSPSLQIDLAETELLSMETRAAWVHLTKAESALSCARVSTSELGRFWLIEGALASMEGDPESTRDSFAAAARVDPQGWISDLGSDLFEQFTQAAAGIYAPGSISVSPLDPGYTVALDGQPHPPESEVDSGLHLVQVSHNGQVLFGRILFVVSGQTNMVDPALPALQAQEPTPPEPPTRSAPITLRAHAAVGFAGAAGASLTRLISDVPTEEPSLKLTAPVELGVTLLPAALWLRASVGVAPWLGGHALYLSGSELQATPVSVNASLGGGLRLDQLELGAGVGVSMPSRTTLRGISSWGPASLPLALELRGGVNTLAGRTPEGAGSAHLLWRPR